MIRGNGLCAFAVSFMFLSSNITLHRNTGRAGEINRLRDEDLYLKVLQDILSQAEGTVTSRLRSIEDEIDRTIDMLSILEANTRLPPPALLPNESWRKSAKEFVAALDTGFKELPLYALHSHSNCISDKCLWLL